MNNLYTLYLENSSLNWEITGASRQIYDGWSRAKYLKSFLQSHLNPCCIVSKCEQNVKDCDRIELSLNRNFNAFNCHRSLLLKTAPPHPSTPPTATLFSSQSHLWCRWGWLPGRQGGDQGLKALRDPRRLAKKAAFWQALSWKPTEANLVNAPGYAGGFLFGW